MKEKYQNLPLRSGVGIIVLNKEKTDLQNILAKYKLQKANPGPNFDKAAEDLRLATRHLGMIVGKVGVEELLGSIFNDFCIGK